MELQISIETVNDFEINRQKISKKGCNAITISGKFCIFAALKVIFASV